MRQQTVLSISACASLNEPPRTTTRPSIFWRPFLVVTLQNNNRHTSARAQKIFPIRNMRPLSIREPLPPDRGYGGLSTGSAVDRGETIETMLFLLLSHLVGAMSTGIGHNTMYIHLYFTKIGSSKLMRKKL